MYKNVITYAAVTEGFESIFGEMMLMGEFDEQEIQVGYRYLYGAGSQKFEYWVRCFQED